MKFLHISDSSLGLSFPVLSDTPENLIEKVREKHSSAELFLINANYKSENIARADNAGILFLKYLRLHHFKQHCVLYSFLSREQLMVQDPLNSIIFSEGVTFIRMPEDLSNIDFQSLAKRQAPDNLSSFFKAEFRLPDNRHFFANWWGVLQLWKVQKAVEKIAGKTVISDIESGFAGSLKEMHSYDGLVARYVKGIHDTDIGNTLRALITVKEENFKNESRNRRQIQEEIDNLLAEDCKLDIQILTLEEINIEKKNNFLIKLIAKFNNLPSSVQQKINELNAKRKSVKNRILENQKFLELLALINKEKEHGYEKRRKLNREIQSKIDTLISCNSFLTENYSLYNIRQQLANKKPSILFVDDLANEGWAAIFQRMIYGKNCDNFTVIQPQRTDSIESIVSSIEQEVETKKPALLILDLRLKGESGSKLSIREISGIQVLEKLIKSQLPCPILITSASNKIWSYRETLKLGADAYWIKEGLDDNYSLEATCENYLRLIDLIYTLCYNEEYRFLYDKLFPVILKIKNSTTPFWWETKFWNQDSFTFKRNAKTIKVNKSILFAKAEVIDTFSAGFDLFKNYLSEKIQIYETIKSSKYIASLVIIQFSRVLEIIHRFDENNVLISLFEKMQAQLDDQKFNYFSKLITIRNSATHNFSAGFSTIKNFIDLFIDYLNSLDIPAKESIENGIILSEPKRGEWYSSEIESRNNNNPNWYHLKNPNLLLESDRTHILLDISVDHKLNPDELKIGDKIKFQLGISEVPGRISYFANNAEKIEQSKVSL